MRNTSGKAEPGTDAYAQWFGTTIPRAMPESSAWRKSQQEDLFAMTEEFENGPIQICEPWDARSKLLELFPVLSVCVNILLK